jgi:hypothetical protein
MSFTDFKEGSSMKNILCLIFLGSTWLLPISSFAQRISISPQDSVVIPGLPPIGKWMIDKNNDVAHWLGYKYNNLQIDEPINIIIRINAENSAEAQQKLLNATHAAGFSEHHHHSSGYKAYIDAQVESQFSTIPDTAFSEGGFFEPNNHGRIFGPLLWGNHYFFLAAFSRENVAPFKKLMNHKTLFHPYASFNQARDRFANQMQNKGHAMISSFIFLGNAIPDDGTQTTGDHDGVAILLDL